MTLGEFINKFFFWQGLFQGGSGLWTVNYNTVYTLILPLVGLKIFGNIKF